MALRGGFLHRLLLGAIILATTSASQKDSGCERTCGSVNIPYPFGSSEGCYLDRDFLISCRNSVSSGSLRPYMGNGNVTVLNISLDGKLRISRDIAKRCYKPFDAKAKKISSVPELEMTPHAALRLAQFRVSSDKNKIIAVGCATYVYIRAFDGDKYYTTGCLSLCDSTGSNVVSGSCSGIGCCQTSIPKGATYYNLSVGSLDYNQHGCGFGFIVDQDAFNFSSLDLADLRGNTSMPLVLDWAIGRNNCKVAEKNKTSYACKAKNSHCYTSINGPGYLCNCSSGYNGNPYQPDGCEDVNECETSNPCNVTETCINLAGSFNCSCPKGYEGDGRKNGTGCTPRDKKSSTSIITIALGVGIGIMTMLVFSSWLYFVLKRRKFIKLKEKYFQQNGGFILEQRLKKSQRGSHKTVKIFTTEELEKATKKYDESRIIGRGGFGIVYKGFLSDNRIVAIKKSKIVNQNQAEQFINEVVVLSQINHRHVVKLLGCCFETPVPLLVYEFVQKGTLFKYIHEESSKSTLTWGIRLRIATETAEALSYLHSAASTPIIHRDVKSSNILLDDDLTAKVSDFGTSKLVPQDEDVFATVVQGTLGYLDPEYIQTHQLTEKSDVYSFGVLLVELLTGKEVLSFKRPEEERSLAMYFLSSLKNDRLSEVLENFTVEESNEDQIKEVVKIAKCCLEVKGEERPTMKEVAVQLDGLRKKEKHPWANVDISHAEEAESLLGEISVAQKDGGSRNSAETAGYDSTRNPLVPFELGDGR